MAEKKVKNEKNVYKEFWELANQAQDLLDQYKELNEELEVAFEELSESLNDIINEAIEDDKSLGAGFKIGHSYFCPNLKDRKGNKKDIQDIIIYEIIPLIEEYWYDNPDSIIQWKDALNGALDD